MRLSKKFLSDYIDLEGITMQELANQMVLAGNEYESIEKLCQAIDLVIGEVIECVDHPDSDHLHICQVTIGDEIKQIVCGASNVRKGIKVIVAKIGAVLPGGIVIKETTLAGMKSEGMICSLEELGLESKYLTEEDKTGIHVLGQDAIVGEDPIQYLQLDDTIIDLELTANRADLLSIIGLSYEVGAIFNRKITLPEFELEETSEDINETYEIDVRTDACPIYLGKLVKNVTIGDSPVFIQRRLMASGIRPINNVVDISNYVMLEYGNPLHFFDAEKLGNKIVVRMSNEDEKLTTLDSVTRNLQVTDIVIANEEEAVALAGVMGGYSTEITETTKDIFIEAAIFDSYHIRKTSHRILRSEASSRYEKGIDPNRTEKALERAAYLLSKYATGTITKGILKHDVIAKENKKITITLQHINEVLGMDLLVQDVEQVFHRLDFSYKEDQTVFEVYVPTRRLDIHIKEDLIEEIGRIYGYEHIEGVLPTTTLKRGTRTHKNNISKQLTSRLNGLGLYQVMTYSLTSKKLVPQFVSELKEEVNLLSPMTEDRSVMRQSIIPSLIGVYEYNAARNNKNINIFELGSVYYKDPNYVEETKVAGLLAGEYEGNQWQSNIIKADFYIMKGIVEDLLTYLGYKNRYSFGTETLTDLHPGMSCSIKVDQEIIGYMGRVHPSIHKNEIYVFEFSLDKLLTKQVRLLKFKELSKYPTVHKDVAFIVPKEMASEQIMSILKRVGGRLLQHIDVFDVYVGENVGENEKSLAYSLTFQNQDRTLNDEEVTQIFHKMITEVESKLHIKLRSK